MRVWSHHVAPQDNPMPSDRLRIGERRDAAANRAEKQQGQHICAPPLRQPTVLQPGTFVSRKSARKCLGRGSQRAHGQRRAFWPLHSAPPTRLRNWAPPRGAFGSGHHKSKFTETDIPIIRARRDAGELLSVLAAEYGVGVSTIYGIAKRLFWRHVPRFCSDVRFQFERRPLPGVPGVPRTGTPIPRG